MSGTSSRQPYFDFLRGLAIIMVVGIHSMRNYSPGFQSLEDVCVVLLRSMLNCAVPLFLAISGFFLGKKQIADKASYFHFLRKQVSKIYIPCLIFSFPYLVMAIVAGRDTVLHSISYFFLCGFSVYYFIALIIQYYAILPILSKLRGGGGS